MGGKQVFETQFSRPRITLLAALCLAYCAFAMFVMGMIGADLWPRQPSFFQRAAGCCIFAFMALNFMHYVSLLRKGSPALRIDAEGLLNRRISDIVVPWEQIEQVHVKQVRYGRWPVTIWTQRFIEYRVDPALLRKLTGEMGWVLRLLRLGTRGRLTLASAVLECGFEPLADALRTIPPASKRLVEG